MAKTEKEKKGKEGKEPQASESVEEREVSTRELLEIIRAQQGEMARMKEAHNKMVDLLAELGERLEKGGEGRSGGLGEIAGLIKAIAPILGGQERSPFHDIGVFTFKQFLRTTMGKKAVKKAVSEMAESAEKGETEKEEEE